MKTIINQLKQEIAEAENALSQKGLSPHEKSYWKGIVKKCTAKIKQYE